MATAMDLEEEVRYMALLHAGAKMDDWEWSHLDMAEKMNSTVVVGGMLVGDERHRDMANRAIKANMEHLFSTKAYAESTKAIRGTAKEAAMIMGRSVEEVPVDAQGNVIIPEGMVFIPWDDPEEPQPPPPPPSKADGDGGGLLGLLTKTA